MTKAKAFLIAGIVLIAVGLPAVAVGLGTQSTAFTVVGASEFACGSVLLLVSQLTRRR